MSSRRSACLQHGAVGESCAGQERAACTGCLPELERVKSADAQACRAVSTGARTGWGTSWGRRRACRAARPPAPPQQGAWRTLERGRAGGGGGGRVHGDGARALGSGTAQGRTPRLGTAWTRPGGGGAAHFSRMTTRIHPPVGAAGSAASPSAINPPAHQLLGKQASGVPCSRLRVRAGTAAWGAPSAPPRHPPPTRTAVCDGSAITP